MQHVAREVSTARSVTHQPRLCGSRLSAGCRAVSGIASDMRERFAFTAADTPHRFGWRIAFGSSGQRSHAEATAQWRPLCYSAFSPLGSSPTDWVGLRRGSRGSRGSVCSREPRGNHVEGEHHGRGEHAAPRRIE